jgi:L-histidine Nalpha-methyltransferase
MTTQVVLPACSEVFEQVGSAVRLGLSAHRKKLPPWLFYDAAGSALFEQITELPEYYLTRTERSILAAHAGAIVAEAGNGSEVRIVELGAGSASKTRLLLSAALARQPSVVFEPVDVSASALEAGCDLIEREIPGVLVAPRVMDYTRELEFDAVAPDVRRLVLSIGSSIGNFEPQEAVDLLARVRARLPKGDSVLLGVDLVKDRETLLAAYDDAAGVTAAFNRNLLARLNRELGAEFDPRAFFHRVRWNEAASRIEMHLVSRAAQTVPIAALDLEVDFAAGESIHTENCYKFPPGAAEELLLSAGFTPVATFTDAREWFAVCQGRAE